MEWLREKWRGCSEKPLMFLIIACLLVSILGPCFRMADRPVYATSDQDGNSDYSFYRLADTAASALSTAFASNQDPETELATYFGDAPAASMGGILGYTSKDNNRGIWGMFMAALSRGSNTKEYSSMAAGNGQSTSLVGKIGEQNGVMMPYVTLGAVLNDLGLDKSDSGSNFLETLKRGLFGIVAQIAFQMAYAVTGIFNFAIGVLKFFNPFQFFSRAGGGSSGQTVTYNGFVDEMQAVHGTPIFGLDPNNAFDGLITIVSKFWDILHVCGIVLLTVYLAVIVFRFFMPGSFGRLTGMRRWVTRALFIIGGIAILGGTYTTALNWLQDMTADGNTAAVKVIASTFFDFETWAMNGMPLYSASGQAPQFAAKYDRGTISSGDLDVQSLCLQMNRTVNGSLAYIGDVGMSGSEPGDIYGNIVQGVQQMYTGGGQTTDSIMEWSFDLLTRYMSGAKIYSSSYESAWKAKHWDKQSAGDALRSYINYSDDVDSILSDTEIKDGRWTSPNLSVTGESGSVGTVRNPFAPGTGSVFSIYASGAYKGQPISGMVNIDTSTKGSGTVTVNETGRFSAMSVYNYLNTTFSPNNITIYSSENSSSEFVRDTHYAVNLVGAGWNSLIVFLLCILLLLSYALLGFFYGFSIILGNVMRGFRMIMAVPGAMIGNIASIAKVVAYAVLMIVEVLATIFLYTVVSEVLFVLTTAVTKGFQGVINMLAGSPVGGATGFVVVAMSPLIGIVSCFFMVWFCIKAIRLRKPVVKMFEEIADNAVQKFIIGPDATPNGPQGGRGGSGAGAMAAGAAAGAGAASAKRKGGVLGKMEARNARVQAEDEMRLSRMFGGTGSSATGEERAIEQHKEVKKAAKQEERRAKMEAGKQMVVGGAEAVAGAYTGNAALAARGMSNLAGGQQNMNQAGINKDAQIAASASMQAGSLGANDPKTMATAQAYYRPIQKMDLGQEATGAAQTAFMGTQMQGMGAGASQSQANMAQGAGDIPGTGVANGSQPGGQHVNTPQAAQQNSSALSDGNHNIVQGLNGQPTPVPSSGETLPDNNGRDTLTRIGDRRVLIQGSTGRIEMEMRDDGSWEPKGGTASSAETIRLTKTVNAVVASELNMRAEQSGSSMRYGIDKNTGAVVPVTQETVNGLNVIDLKTADEVRKTAEGRKVVLPSTPAEVQEQLRQVTGHDLVSIEAMTSIRREQAGQVVQAASQGAADGIRVPGVRQETRVTGTDITVNDDSQVRQGSGKALRQPQFQRDIITADSRETVSGGTQYEISGGQAPAPAASGGKQLGQSRNTSRRTVNHVTDYQDQHVESRQGATYVAGLGSQAPQGSGGSVTWTTQSRSTTQDIIRHGRMVVNQYDGESQTGSSGPDRGSASGQGRQESRQVVDSVTVTHQTDVRHQDGGRSGDSYDVFGSGRARGSQSHESVTDRHTVEHDTRVEHRSGGMSDTGYSAPGFDFKSTSGVAQAHDKTVVEHLRETQHKDGGLKVTGIDPNLRDKKSGLGDGFDE